MRFQFSQFQTWVEAEGEIVWKSDSKKTAGVRFVGLPLEARHRIQTWILSTSEESGTVAQSLDLEKQEFTIAIPLSEKVNPIPIATSAAENVFSLSYPGSANGRNTNENVQSNGPRTRLWISMAILIGIAFLSLVAFKKLHLPTIIYGVQGRKEEPTAAKAPLPATVTLGKPPSARPEAVTDVPTFVLQVGAMAHEENANTLADSLVQRNFPGFVAKPGDGRLYFVFVGPYKDAEDTTKIKRELEQRGFTSIRREWKAPRSNDVSDKSNHRP